MSEDEKLKAIRKTSREQMPLRAGRGAGFHGSKGYDRREEEEGWRRVVWQQDEIDVDPAPPGESGMEQ